jgi:hypothetical protein
MEIVFSAGGIGKCEADINFQLVPLEELNLQKK